MLIDYLKPPRFSSFILDFWQTFALAHYRADCSFIFLLPRAPGSGALGDAAAQLFIASSIRHERDGFFSRRIKECRQRVDAQAASSSHEGLRWPGMRFASDNTIARRPYCAAAAFLMAAFDFKALEPPPLSDWIDIGFQRYGRAGHQVESG